MKIGKCRKETFTVIGKEGSTEAGPGFIQKLWEDANAHFSDISHLAKRDERGNLVGIWGAMSDASHSFAPWEDGFTTGVYLAGAECLDGAEAPEGWTRWRIPGYEYLYVENRGDDTFQQMIQYMEENDIKLAGAVQEGNCPETGKGFLYFPIGRL